MTKNIFNKVILILLFFCYFSYANEQKIDDTIKYKLVLRDGSPESVKEFFGKLPDLGKDYIERENKKLQNKLEDAEFVLKEIKNRKVGKVPTSSLGGKETDLKELKQKGQDYKEQLENIKAIKKSILEFNNNIDSPEVQLWKNSIRAPWIYEIKVGVWGKLVYKTEVVQIISNSEAIIETENEYVWLSGFDTSKINQAEKTIYFREIKKYTTDTGKILNCYYAEPFIAKDFIELVKE